MGPDLELKERSEIVMEASTSKGNGNVVKELEDKNMSCASNYDVKAPEYKNMSCASNYEDNNYETGVLLDGRNDEVRRSEDVEVNIMECTDSGDNVLVEGGYQDATEDSSSFGDSVSGVENGAMLGEAEVVSEFHGDASPALEFDGFGELFRMRRKRLTAHWRTFIQPLTWRCKWVELQIKRFQSQAIKYDTELAGNNQRKQFKLENFTLEGCGAKSLPFSTQSRREKVMKRKKRKRVEGTMDTAAYMSQHNLFSYYDKRRSTADVASMDDDRDNLVISTDKKIKGNEDFEVSDELLPLEFRDGDNSLEQVLWKIGVVQAQVCELKTRLNKVTSESAGKFSSTDKLSLLVPYNPLTSSARNLASPPNNGDRMPVGSSYIASQLRHEYNMGDLLMPESAVSSHGELTHLPDIIESTDQLQVGDSCKNTGDDILIYDWRVKEELCNFEEVKIQPIEKPRLLKEEQRSIIPPVPVPVLEDLPMDQPTPKVRSISKLTAPENKRKRGRRKAGSGKWSRRSSE